MFCPIIKPGIFYVIGEWILHKRQNSFASGLRAISPQYTLIHSRLLNFREITLLVILISIL